MHKKLNLLLIILTIIFISGCFTNNIANTKDEVGELNIAGKWPNTMSISNNSNLISASIPSATTKIKFKITNSLNSISYEKEVSRTANEHSFSLSFQALTAGIWKISGEAFDSSGNSVGKIKTKDIIIAPTVNTFSAVFGPESYSELFIGDSFYKLLGDYTHHFDIISYLKIAKTYLNYREAFQISITYNDSTSYNYLAQNDFMDWVQFNSVDMSSDRKTPKINTNYVSGHSASTTYTYNSDGLITEGQYTNDSSKDSTLSSEYNLTATTIVKYNSDSRINALDTIAYEGDTKTFSENLVIDYSNGNLSTANVTMLDSTNSSNMTFSYLNGKLITYSDYNSSGSLNRSETITWNGNNISKIKYTETNTNSTSTTRNGFKTFDYGNDEYLDKITITETEDSNYSQIIQYEYNDNHYLTKLTKTRYNGAEVDEKTEVIFTYSKTKTYRVTNVDYYIYSESSPYLMFSEELQYINE